MTSRRGRLLIAVEAGELFRRFESCISRDVRAAESLRPEHCLPDQLEPILRDYEADAVILIQPRFHDDLPAAVRRWKTLRPDLQPLFLFRRLPNTRSVVDLMRAGAFDVIDTEIEAIGAPLIHDVLSALLRRLQEVRTGNFERAHARGSLADVGLIGESVEAQNLFVQILHAARISSPVLISGEPGSGKRLAAHAIHALGPRADREIVTVDCLSLSPPLLNAALFGKAGSHTAGRGTILLNEISEIPPAVQARLQKTLESADGDGAATSDVRIVSTTARHMDRLVEARSFRADLYYGLNVLPIEIPPLRRRLKDVPVLAQYFLSRLERDGRTLNVSAEAAQALGGYHWPGNVRELKNALESAVVRSRGGEILPAHLPESILASGRGTEQQEPFVSNELNLARLERQAILRALQISGFDKAKSARLLGIGKTTMYRKLKELSGKKTAIGSQLSVISRSAGG
jgi:two-component system, NtrC family, response regulator HydG